MASTNDVEHCLTRGNQVIGYNSPVAPPPHGFCAHHGATLALPEFLQPRQSAVKAFAHRVVRVVVKALILPERVDVPRHVARAATQPAQ
jgi:hypothetical protein